MDDFGSDSNFIRNEMGIQKSDLERIGLCEWLRCVFVLRNWLVLGLCSGV